MAVMDDAELDKIALKAAATSPGPWVVKQKPGVVLGMIYSGQEMIAYGSYLPDTQFMASAKDDVPRLVARIRELSGILREILMADARDDAARRAEAIVEAHSLLIPNRSDS